MASETLKAAIPNSGAVFRLYVLCGRGSSGCWLGLGFLHTLLIAHGCGQLGVSLSHFFRLCDQLILLFVKLKCKSNVIAVDRRVDWNSQRLCLQQRPGLYMGMMPHPGPAAVATYWHQRYPKHLTLHVDLR